ncbi:YkoF family thiamine/hydroxymethylpyrimidine-binding protein [Lapidilactobacillus wuchangensis]|uniref:YkoF family thiamine/hydroxymethylpyrimidine-binding protein n=1 Tax=Lapidilactobacillus wuchangensis TaxID=2486001 RepID=UPI000F776088|nr:YkoF family thiamine/hydroxymethylpyrimidine-binding protein [Lapidilactobacillus wuchangensis]
MASCATNGIDITGVRASLYPMRADFAKQILESVAVTDTSAVWQQTDLFSTVYRGESASVVDAAAGLFVNAYDTTTHLVGEFTFSKGCPGDIAGDSYLTGQQLRPNAAVIKEKGDFLVHCKYSFYTFGRDDYMTEIEHIVTMAADAGLQPEHAHYCTFLTGTAAQLFNYFAEILAYAHDHMSHYVVEATVSVNSPSLEEN